ncbi:MAG: hypothetical protein ACUVSU_15070 [Aggregatilineaceae bacterium]
MNVHYRGLIAVTLAVMLVAPSLPALAQGDQPPVNCNGLSDADCQVIVESTVAMQGLQSVTVPEWGIDLAVSDDQQTMAVQLAGAAMLMLPPDLRELALAWTGLSWRFDPTALIATLEATLERLDAATIQTMLRGLGFYLMLDEMRLPQPGQSLSGPIEIIFKDMGVYLHAPSPTGADTWFGETLALTPEDLIQLEASLREALTGLQSEETQQMLAQLSELSGPVERLQMLASEYISTTRGADGVYDGQTMFTFTTSFDLEGFLADPNLPALVLALLKNPALAALDLDLGDLETINEAQVQFLLMTVSLLVTDARLSMEQWIGAQDRYVHRLGFDLGLDLNLALLGEEAETQAASVQATVYAVLDAINTTTLDAVTIPADYYPLDDSDDYLVGTPDQIKAPLVMGQAVSGAFVNVDGEARDLYSLSLQAGDTVQIALASEDYPYLNIYGPDGFLAEEFDTYYERTATFTAEQTGVHLFVVYAYWDMAYELTVSAVPRP